MKAGCSIVEKPEGGGGEPQLILYGVPWTPLQSAFLLTWTLYTNARPHLTPLDRVDTVWAFEGSFPVYI